MSNEVRWSKHIILMRCMNVTASGGVLVVVSEAEVLAVRDATRVAEESIRAPEST